MQVRPLTAEEIEKLEEHHRKMHNWSRRTHFTCSFCGQSVHYQKYADHVEKSHPGGRFFKPFAKSKPNATLLFAEWQQADATAEELAELAE